MYRVLVHKFITKRNKGTYDITKHGKSHSQPKDNDLISNVDHTEERDQKKGKKELFRWRSHYPNSSNVYVGKPLGDAEADYIEIPYGKDETKQTLFNLGGIAYLPDPFSSENFLNEKICLHVFNGLYRNVKGRYISDITMDDLADAATHKIKEYVPPIFEQQAKPKDEADAKADAKAKGKGKGEGDAESDKDGDDADDDANEDADEDGDDDDENENDKGGKKKEVKRPDGSDGNIMNKRDFKVEKEEVAAPKPDAAS